MKYLYFIDPKTGKHSVTLTMLVYSFGMAMVKWAFAGNTYLGHTFPDFNYSGTALILGAIYALYAGRKHTDTKK